MAQRYPYIHYACPCTDDNSVPAAHATNGIAQDTELTAEVDDEEGKTFNPHAPTASYSLFPLEHLLYCDECRQLRCPRCIGEEPLIWFCPSCLFEVPSSSVRTENVR